MKKTMVKCGDEVKASCVGSYHLCVYVYIRERETNGNTDQNSETKPASSEEIFIYGRVSIHLPKTKIKECLPGGGRRGDVCEISVDLASVLKCADHLLAPGGPALMSSPSHGDHHEMYPCSISCQVVEVMCMRG